MIPKLSDPVFCFNTAGGLGCYCGVLTTLQPEPHHLTLDTWFSGKASPPPPTALQPAHSWQKAPLSGQIPPTPTSLRGPSTHPPAGFKPSQQFLPHATGPPCPEVLVPQLGTHAPQVFLPPSFPWGREHFLVSYFLRQTCKLRLNCKGAHLPRCLCNLLICSGR